MGYSTKKKKERRGWGYTFLKKKNPRIFTFVTLSWEILQNCVTPLGNSKVKNHDPWKFHKFFVNTLWNSISILTDLWNFHMFFFQYPLKLNVLSPTSLVWVFSRLAQFTISYKLINQNLQRIIFRIFSHLSTKLISNKVKK